MVCIKILADGFAIKLAIDKTLNLNYCEIIVAIELICRTKRVIVKLVVRIDLELKAFGISLVAKHFGI